MVPVGYLQASLRDLADSKALRVALVAMEHSDYWVAEQMVEHCMVTVHAESWVVGGQADWKMTVEGCKYWQQMRVSRVAGMKVR